MASRQAMEATIRDIYRARERGDVETIMGHVAPGFTLCLAGCSNSSPVPTTVEGAESVRAALSSLSSAFELSNIEIVSLLLDGDQAAAQIRFRVRATASDRQGETESFDLFRFDGDRVVSYKQFFDTAFATRLVAG